MHQRSKKSAHIKIGAAIFTTIAVAIWDFFPPSLIFSALCVTFISMTALLERSIISHINENADNYLQRAIAAIKTPMSALLKPDLEEANVDEAKLRDQMTEIRRARHDFTAQVYAEQKMVNDAALELATQKSLFELQKKQFQNLVEEHTVGVQENISSSSQILIRLADIGKITPTLISASANHGEIQHKPLFQTAPLLPSVEPSSLTQDRSLDNFL